jgi:integrase
MCCAACRTNQTLTHRLFTTFNLDQLMQAGQSWDRLRRRAQKHGVRPLKLHTARHTFATLSLEAGRSVKWVSQQLGHRSASLTFDTYSHALPDEEVDLSYLPVTGDVTTSHPGVTSATLQRVNNSVSS